MESKILTIGDCGVDVYPEEGYGYMGGMAFNVACKAAAFGSKSAYMGVLGTDYNTSQIRDYAQSVGVDLSHCATEEGECLYVMVKIIDGERHFSAGNRGGVQRLFPLQLKEGDIDYIKSFDLVHLTFGGYIEPLIPTVAATGIPTSFDFVTFVTPEKESIIAEIAPHISVAVMSVGEAMTEEEIKEKLCYLRSFGPPVVIATRGEKGSMLYDGRGFVSFGIIPCKVVDTLAAGDSFIAGAISTLAKYPECLTRDGSAKPLPVEVAEQALKNGAAMSSKTLQMQGSTGKPFMLEKK